MYDDMDPFSQLSVEAATDKKDPMTMDAKTGRELEPTRDYRKPSRPESDGNGPQKEHAVRPRQHQAKYLQALTTHQTSTPLVSPAAIQTAIPPTQTSSNVPGAYSGPFASPPPRLQRDEQTNPHSRRHTSIWAPAFPARVNTCIMITPNQVPANIPEEKRKRPRGYSKRLAELRKRRSEERSQANGAADTYSESRKRARIDAGTLGLANSESHGVTVDHSGSSLAGEEGDKVQLDKDMDTVVPIGKPWGGQTRNDLEERDIVDVLLEEWTVAAH